MWFYFTILNVVVLRLFFYAIMKAIKSLSSYINDANGKTKQITNLNGGFSNDSLQRIFQLSNSPIKSLIINLDKVPQLILKLVQRKTHGIINIILFELFLTYFYWQNWYIMSFDKYNFFFKTDKIWRDYLIVRRFGLFFLLFPFILFYGFCLLLPFSFNFLHFLFLSLEL